MRTCADSIEGSTSTRKRRVLWLPMPNAFDVFPLLEWFDVCLQKDVIYLAYSPVRALCPPKVDGIKANAVKSALGVGRQTTMEHSLLYIYTAPRALVKLE